MTDLQVKYFLRVAEQMSFTAASWQLHVSQSSVSRQIIALERELDCRLIDRSKKNSLRLTPAGEVYFHCFKRMENELRDGVAAARLTSQQGGSVLRVGVGEGWDLAGLVEEVEREVSKLPQASVEFTEYSFRDLYEHLNEGLIDLAVCTETSIRSTESLSIIPLSEVRYTVYFSAGNPLSAGPAALPAQLPRQPLYVLPDDETPLSTAVSCATFLAYGVKPRVVVCPNRSTICLRLSSGVGFTVFDDLMRLRHDRSLGSFPMDNLIPIAAISRADNSNRLKTPVTDLMRDYFSRHPASRAPNE